MRAPASHSTSQQVEAFKTRQYIMPGPRMMRFQSGKKMFLLEEPHWRNLYELSSVGNLVIYISTSCWCVAPVWESPQVPGEAGKCCVGPWWDSRVLLEAALHLHVKCQRRHTCKLCPPFSHLNPMQRNKWYRLHGPWRDVSFLCSVWEPLSRVCVHRHHHPPPPQLSGSPLLADPLKQTMENHDT